MGNSEKESQRLKISKLDDNSDEQNVVNVNVKTRENLKHVALEILSDTLKTNESNSSNSGLSKTSFKNAAKENCEESKPFTPLEKQHNATPSDDIQDNDRGTNFAPILFCVLGV